MPVSAGGCRRVGVVASWIAAASLAGCGGPQQPDQEHGHAETPRPVQVIRLATTNPASRGTHTGSVVPWKTEQMAFEVSGRLQFVAELETAVEGRTFDADGKLLTRGSLLARLDDYRYKLQAEAANSELNTVTQQIAAANVELTDVIPAEIKVAQAKATFAAAEAKRQAALVKENAVSEQEYEKAVAQHDMSVAQLERQTATKKTKAAELASLGAQLKAARQKVSLAKRDQFDSYLASPYRGQVTGVHAIAGAFVEAGAAVVTVQMMDPMKVEFEVSARSVDDLNYADIVPIYLTDGRQQAASMHGYLYAIDGQADDRTRTFTVTLMVRNRKTRQQIPDSLEGQPIVRTRHVWRLFDNMVVGYEGRWFVNLAAVGRDDSDYYVWKVTNRSRSVGQTYADDVLEVEKIRVTIGDVRIPLFGRWVLGDITINEGQPFDPKTDLIAGKLEFPPGVSASGRSESSGTSAVWGGSKVLLEQSRWLLQSGDVVRVDLRADAAPPGIYLPAGAVAGQTDQRFVFTVSENGESLTANKVPVRVTHQFEGLLRVESESLADGQQVVANGAHYLNDGELVQISSVVESGE